MYFSCIEYFTLHSSKQDQFLVVQNEKSEQVLAEKSFDKNDQCPVAILMFTPATVNYV